MSRQELETQYTPSLFSQRFSSRDELLNHFAKFSFDESQKIRQEYDCHLNISYGKTKRQKLDIFGEDLPSNAPLFVFIHGGYWQMLDKENSAFIVRPFVNKGVRCIVMDYDLCPVVTLKALVEQIHNFFAWLSDYIREKSIKNVSIAGHSAGAHLLAFGLSEKFLSSLPKEINIDAFFVSGVFYLDELRHLDAGNEKNILSLDDSNFMELSPQYMNFDFFANFNIKCHVYAGEFESDKFKDHSLKFGQGPLRDFTHNLKILEQCDHFSIVENFITEKDYEITNHVLKSLNVAQ